MLPFVVLPKIKNQKWIVSRSVCVFRICYSVFMAFNKRRCMMVCTVSVVHGVENDAVEDVDASAKNPQ